MRSLEIKKDRRREGGFTMIELMLVVGLVVILTAIAVFALTPNQRNYATDEAASQLISALRYAYQRALAERQTMRVQIDLNTSELILFDEGSLPGGDEQEIRREPLVGGVMVGRPTVSGTPMPLPPAPYSYTPAIFSGNVWTCRFRSDGSVFDAAGNLMSATVYFAPANMTANDRDLVRAVTVFGPSGSIRYWRWNETRFTAETR